MGDIGQALLWAAPVGHIAAPFPRDVQFSSQLFIGLQQHNLCPALRGGERGHHACRPAPGHNDLSLHRLSHRSILSRPPTDRDTHEKRPGLFAKGRAGAVQARYGDESPAFS